MGVISTMIVGDGHEASVEQFATLRKGVYRDAGDDPFADDSGRHSLRSPPRIFELFGVRRRRVFLRDETRE